MHWLYRVWSFEVCLLKLRTVLLPAANFWPQE